MRVAGGPSAACQPVRCTPLWPASWLPVVDKTRGSKSVEVRRVWEVYDERLQFVSCRDASLLDDCLDQDDVTLAWSVWSRVAESALADAFQFSGGPLPSWGLVLGRGAAMFRRVQQGGHWVRRARANAADALDAADVFLYRDFSIAPQLDMRRRFKAVMDILDAMIRYGVSLSRSVVLTAQWDLILALGPVYPVTLDDLSAGCNLGIGVFSGVVAGVHRRLCDLSIRLWCIDVMKLFGSGVIGFGKIPWFILIVGFVLIWCRLPPFFSVILVVLLMVLVFYLILIRLMQNSEWPGFPTFAVLGKGRPALTNSALRLMDGCRFFLRFISLG